MKRLATVFGLTLALLAGACSHAVVTLWEKMSPAGSGQPPQWLSTHPAHEKRIKELRQTSDRFEPLHDAARERNLALSLKLGFT